MSVIVLAAGKEQQNNGSHPRTSYFLVRTAAKEKQLSLMKNRERVLTSDAGTEPATPCCKKGVTPKPYNAFLANNDHTTQESVHGARAHPWKGSRTRPPFLPWLLLKKPLCCLEKKGCLELDQLQYSTAKKEPRVERAFFYSPPFLSRSSSPRSTRTLFGRIEGGHWVVLAVQDNCLSPQSPQTFYDCWWWAASLDFSCLIHRNIPKDVWKRDWGRHM